MRMPTDSRSMSTLELLPCRWDVLINDFKLNVDEGEGACECEPATPLLFLLLVILGSYYSTSEYDR